MSLYVIEKRCVATVDGKAIHYRPGDRPFEIDDAVAGGLGDSVKRYGADAPSEPESNESESVEVPADAVLTTTPDEPEAVPEPRGRRPRPGGGDG
jgi:hypothetical protein